MKTAASHWALVALLSHLVLLASGTAMPQYAAPKWTALSPHPIGVGEAQGTIIKGNGDHPYELMVTGGYIAGLSVVKASYSYPVGYDTPRPWKRRAALPLPLTHCGQVAVGHFLYLCGGYLGHHPGPSVANCFRYDTIADTWTGIQSLPEPRAGGALLFDPTRNALVFSGGAVRFKGNGHVTDHGDTWVLKLHSPDERWQPKAFMPDPRNHMAGATVEGRLFFIGGQKGTNEFSGNSRHLQEFDLKKNVWVERAQIPYGVGHVSASTPSYGPGFFVIGGVVNGRKKTGQILYYHIHEDKWHFFGTYPATVQTPVCGCQWDRIVCATSFGTGKGTLGFVRKIRLALV